MFQVNFTNNWIPDVDFLPFFVKYFDLHSFKITVNNSEYGRYHMIVGAVGGNSARKLAFVERLNEDVPINLVEQIQDCSK